MENYTVTIIKEVSNLADGRGENLKCWEQEVIFTRKELHELFAKLGYNSYTGYFKTFEVVEEAGKQTEYYEYLIKKGY